MADYDNDPGFADWLNKRGEGHLLNSAGATPAAPKPEEDPGFADWLNKRGEGHLLQPAAPPPAAPVAQNGLPYELGKQLIAGAAVDAPKMLAKAGEWFSPAGSGAEEMFREGKKSWGADEAGWEPQTEGRSALGKMLVGGARSAAPSVAAMGAAIANPFVAVPAIAGVFGGSQAQDTYDKARGEGRGHDEARDIGWKTGAIEGLGETVGDVLGGKFLQGAYKGVGLLAGTAGKEGLGAALKQATSPKWAGTFAKDWAGNAAVQSATEYGQGYGEAAVEQAHGLRTMAPHEAGMEGAGAALGLSMLLGPFMGYGHARAGSQRAELGRVLADPSTPLETKLALGKQLHDNVVLPQVGEEQAASWLQSFNESAVQGFGGRDERAGLPNGELPLTQNRPTNLLASEPPAMPTEQMEMFGAPPTTPTEQMEMFGEPPAGPVAPPVAMSEGLADTSAIDATQTLSLDEQITAHDKGIEAATKSLARAKTDKTRATWQAKLDALTAKRDAAVQAKAAVGERTLRNATPTSVLTPATDTSQQGALPLNEPVQPAPAAEATGNVAPVEPTTTTSIYEEDTADEAPDLTPEQELELGADLGGAIDAYNATERAAPVKGAKGAKAATTSKAKGAGPLNVDVKDDNVRVLEGKVGREDQGWLATVARALAGGTWADKGKKGNAGPKFAKPRYYAAGTNTPDPQLEAAHGAKVEAVMAALHKLTRAAADLYNKKSNLLPATKAKGEVGTETAEAARHRDEYDKAHAATRAAVEELKAAAGSEKAVEAVIAAYKMRVHKWQKAGSVRQKDTPKANYHVAVDALASRAWADYKHGALAEGKADTIRERPVRRSWEMEKRKLEDSPLKAAATEGHTRRVATKANTVNNPPETGLLGVVNYLQMHGGAFEAMLAAAVGRALRQAKTQPAIKWLDDPTSKAYYDPATDTIALHENASPVEALHEALHAALQWYVYSNPNNSHVLALRAALNRLLTPEVLKQAKAHGKAGEVLDVLAKLNKGKDGWKNAVLELISYGGTLNSFREFMKTLDMLSPEERKAADPNYSASGYGKLLEAMKATWRKLTALVQSFLGTTETLANDVLESSMALLNDVEAALDTAAGGTSTARPGATKGKKLDGKLNADVSTEGEGRAPLASEFGAGFGESKVVDDQGRLIPMYHGGADVAGMGSKAIFKVTGRGALGIGGYFTPDKPFAQEYATENGGVVTETYLRVTNPLVLNSTLASDPMVDALVMLGKTQQQAENTVEKAYEEHGYVGAQVKSLAQKQGYDGIMQYREGKLREVVVWNNNQIKHSSNTAPTYGPNILYADVTPDPVDQATEDVLQKHAAATRTVKHTQWAPTRGPLQRMFESWGYTKDTAHDFTMSAITKGLRLVGVTDAAKWAARIVDFRTHLQEWAPRTAQALSMLDAGFNITETMRAIILDVKHMRGVPISVVNNFTRYLEKMPGEQAVDTFAYLDAAAGGTATAEELAALSKDMPANVKEAADHLASVYKEQIKKLESSVGALKEAEYLRSIPLSEALLYVITDDNLSTGNVTGRSYGAHNVNRLLGETMGKALSDNVRTLTAWDGLKTLDGKFYRFTMTNNPGGQELGKYGFVHSGAFGKLTPEERATVDRDQFYRMGVATPEKGGDPTVSHVTFTGTKAVNKLLREGKAEDVSAAMLNTVNLMANATAAAETARHIQQSGEGGTDKNGKPVRKTVFANEAEFRAFVAEDGSNPHADKRLQQVGDAEERSNTIAYLYRHPDAWVQVPDSAAYGALAGHVIRGPEWSALSDAYNRSQFIDSSFYNSTMRGFKKVKTVYNLPTHVTNVLTNITLLYMHNIQVATLKDAAKLYKDFLLAPEKMTPDQHALMKEFIDSGAVLADYSANEMKEVLFKAIEHKVTGGGGLWATTQSMLGAHAELVENIAKKGAKVDETMTALYATGDNVFRLAAFLSEMGRLEQDTANALTHDAQVKAAGRFAATAFLDYDIDARAVQIARQTFLPFVSWTYAITPVLSRIAIEQPWKLVGLGTTFSVLGALASAAAGGDDDDEARKRERMDEKVLLGQFGPYANMRVPFLDSNGKKAYINVGKYIPNPYSFKDQPNGVLGIKNYPSSLAPSGPLMAFAAAVFGIDPYTGKKLTKDTNTNLENALTMGKQFGLQMAPPAATVLAKAGDNGITGKPKDSLNTFASLTGVPPVRRVDTDEARKNAQLSIKKINKDFEAERTRLAGDRKRGNITMDDYLERVKVLRERRLEGIKDYRGG
jgi:hypothetical protein